MNSFRMEPWLFTLALLLIRLVVRECRATAQSTSLRQGLPLDALVQREWPFAG